MNIDKKTWWLISGSAVALGATATVYFLIIKKKSRAGLPKSDKYGNRILKKKNTGGISGGVETATGNKGTTISEPNWNNPFDMNYENDVKKWVSPKGVLVLNNTEAGKMAQILYKAKGSGWWSNDDEEAVKKIFLKRLRDKVQVANLSRAFWFRYKKDMWEYLNSFLSNSEMEGYVHKPVRNLPKYRLA
ncbi:hypothetical protein QQ008_07715 [Fulvivirgaceae bacterium BMA10]|uniref:Uncharacterized protein n=1 Tax=Splendidivirga corallicola TaxID=3051826 RepID=A0ABT8KNF3_9BACT|nr:hypothetical protein [Fulvivirgaceae bacterium BMA10]